MDERCVEKKDAGDVEIRRQRQKEIDLVLPREFTHDPVYMCERLMIIAELYQFVFMQMPQISDQSNPEFLEKSQKNIVDYNALYTAFTSFRGVPQATSHAQYNTHSQIACTKIDPSLKFETTLDACQYATEMVCHLREDTSINKQLELAQAIVVYDPKMNYLLEFAGRYSINYLNILQRRLRGLQDIQNKTHMPIIQPDGFNETEALQRDLNDAIMQMPYNLQTCQMIKAGFEPRLIAYNACSGTIFVGDAWKYHKSEE